MKTREERAYVDTSAYLAVLLGEQGSQAALRALSKRIPCSSSLLLIESERNLVRMSRDKILSASDYRLAMDQLREDREKFVLKDFTVDLCLTGAFPPAKLPRSSDLAHLRTALWFQQNGGLSLFMTLDEAQRHAAADLGLAVWP
jgi:PIN domain-containing protein